MVRVPNTEATFYHDAPDIDTPPRYYDETSLVRSGVVPRNETDPVRWFKYKKY